MNLTYEYIGNRDLWINCGFNVLTSVDFCDQVTSPLAI